MEAGQCARLLSAQRVVKQVLLSWSSGKDSAWTLHVLRQDPTVEVVGLLTTLNAVHDRVAMHAVRRDVLEAQARALALPLDTVPLPWPCSNDDYERAMFQALEGAVLRGVTHLAFGDLFLEDIRAYREKQLAGCGLELIFPIWKEPTDRLARQMLAAGLEAVLTCVDMKQLPASFAGRRFDEDLLRDLPVSADPCGERGEFHTCVLKSPDFREPLEARVGEIVERDGFAFADVVLTTGGVHAIR